MRREMLKLIFLCVTVQNMKQGIIPTLSIKNLLSLISRTRDAFVRFGCYNNLVLAALFPLQLNGYLERLESPIRITFNNDMEDEG